MRLRKTYCLPLLLLYLTIQETADLKVYSTDMTNLQPRPEIVQYDSWTIESPADFKVC